MKLIYFLGMLLFFTNCEAQERQLLVEKSLISDWSQFPIYSVLVQDNGHWKEEYSYLDSIEVYSITYLSDGLKVKGLMVKPKRKSIYPCVI